MKPPSMMRWGNALWLVGVVLLLLGLVIQYGGWTRLDWPLVAAQVQDVQLVKHNQATEQSISTPQWLVQYAYKYVWDGQTK